MNREQDKTRELIEFLKNPTTKLRPFKPKGLDPVVFGTAAVLAIAFVAWGFISPSGLGSVATAALTGVMDNFGWLFVIAATIFTIFVIVVAVSKFGRIPLGKDDEVPEFKTSSWIAMMFATGMGIGLVFYGVGEPLYFYMSPPPGTVEGSSPEALDVAMGTTLFHWTLFPWAMYAIVGLGVAYGTFRLGRSQLFSSMFTPLFGERAVHGAGGKLINILAILATLFGSACSLGLGAIQIGGGIESAGFLSDVTSPVLVIIIAILTAAFVASAVSGVEKGIQWLSNINMVLAVILAIIVFIGGPTLFILNVVPSAVGAFISDLPEMASRTAADGGQTVSDWLSSWTVFYWAWWISWSPFVGLFIARISRGRTIRQFVTGVLIVPSVISLIWFAIFGGGAIGLQERAERGEGTVEALANVVDGVPDINFDLILFDLLRALPLPGIIGVILMVVTVVLIGIFFVTGADSASIVMGGLSENGAIEPRKKTVIFWGVATGAVAAVMLLAGGEDPAAALNGLKNITIVSALPFVLVMLLLCVALWKDLRRDPLIIKRELATHLLDETVATAVDEYDGEVFGLSTQEMSVVSEEDLKRAEGSDSATGPGATTESAATRSRSTADDPL
ncbi:choline/carnitine/betaine transport [Brevibacterium sanguinis]|uniref:Choline/carnitine/betaine transport n=2 Tax=Brevibacterium TaxID=1696 RepID=A0A366IRN8_9MICO|nr:MULTISPECIES: BCCT family transporter [Brevibacterium]RBP67933.1 choline/carnitine/betaine transport [Brevibacterium sanguinis]RBP74650.1 choline/carnitine/betaine transport [Brevibacterium celere]